MHIPVPVLQGLCLLLKKIQEIPVAFSFHFGIRNKAKRCTVDTVTYPVWRFGVICENMTEM